MNIESGHYIELAKGVIYDETRNKIHIVST